MGGTLTERRNQAAPEIGLVERAARERWSAGQVRAAVAVAAPMLTTLEVARCVEVIMEAVKEGKADAKSTVVSETGETG